MQTRIPCVLMRGGTSKGPYFLASDLPREPALRDKVLLSVMGSPDARQIDGLGGADPLTSKVAIVAKSSRPGIDVDYLFAQVGVEQADVDVTPNCGNMLAGVGPFAIEQGLVAPAGAVTPVRIYMENSGNIAVANVQTPSGRVEYAGAARIDGVPGSSAPISIELLDTAGSACGSLLPTGKLVDKIDGIDVTCMDNGMPVVLMRASDLSRTGSESCADLDADTELKARIEAIRLKVGPLMNLGNVTKKVVPKMCLVSAAANGGAISTRCFIPHVCHSAIGVLGAVTVATACVLPGTVAYDLATLPPGAVKLLSIEHPTGEFTVELETDEASNHQAVKRSALLRTARRLMDGHAYVPEAVWSGVQ